MRLLSFAALVLSLSTLSIVGAQDLPDNAGELPISHLLSLASTALASARPHAALSIYDHVLARDPSDFATLYKRATVRLATGQWAKAKEGFADVLKVREFDMAHLELARLHTKLGEYEDGLREVDLYLAMQPEGKHGKEVEEAHGLKNSLHSAAVDFELARTALARSALPDCLTHATAALSLSPNSLPLRLLRADCNLLSGIYDSAIGDLSRASTLSPSLPPHLLIRLSLLTALFLDPAEGLSIPPDSLAAIKRCLSSDPDNKSCRSAFKALKALEKEFAKLRNWIESGRWAEAGLVLAGSSTSPGLIKGIQDLLVTYQRPLSPTSPAPLPSLPGLELDSPLLTALHSTLCRAYLTLNNRKMGAACSEALKFDAEDLWGTVGKGEGLLVSEEYEEASRVLGEAFEKSGRSDRMILEKLQKAQRLLKQSKAKDYYKVLGVARDADSRTIKKAYRKATLKAHPDKEGGSEAKMAALNEAYEVLSNPDLRARFDNGEDPNDPQSGGGQGHPFHHQGGGFPFGQSGGGGQQFFQQGGFPFGGGGHSFKVKFG